MDYYTKSLLHKESIAIQLSWLTNDVVDGVTPKQARQILVSLKEITESVKPVTAGFHPVLFNISLTVDSFEVTDQIISSLEELGASIHDYKKTVMPVNSGSFSIYKIFYECWFYMPINFTTNIFNDVVSSNNKYHGIATRITNNLIAKLLFVPSDYCIGFK